MTIDEMMDALQEARDSGVPGTTQVILGTQPNYPFGSSITTWCIDHTFEPTLNRYGGEWTTETALVFCEGTQLAYGNRKWWDGQDIEPEEMEDED